MTAEIDSKPEAQRLQANSIETKSYGWGWRHVITVLTFFGFFVNYTLRVNLSVALVAMINQTALAGDSHKIVNKSPIACEVIEKNKTKSVKDGEFVWDDYTQGFILASFFYGYILTQIPGGWLAGRFGSKWVFGIGTVWTAALTLLTPLAARAGSGYLIALRILEGLGEGVSWPGIQPLFTRWVHPSERSKLPAFAFSGCFFGTLTAFILSGVLADSNFLGGWPSVFYVFGFIGCVWFVFWVLLVESEPSNHRWISQAEKDYILGSTRNETRPGFGDVPWRSIVRSMPVIAAVVSHFTYNWSLYVLLTGLPQYLKNVMGFDVKSNGVVSSLPYLFQGIVQVSAGHLADMFRGKLNMSTTAVRKLFDCTGHFLPAIFVVAVGHVGCSSTAAVVCLVFSVATSGLCGGGVFVNYLDLAPAFAGVLFGISNMFATVPGIIGPSITGALVQNISDTILAWQIVFYIAGAFYLVSVLFYALFASGNIQPWARFAPKNAGEDERLTTNNA